MGEVSSSKENGVYTEIYLVITRVPTLHVPFERNTVFDIEPTVCMYFYIYSGISYFNTELITILQHL